MKKTRFIKAAPLLALLTLATACCREDNEDPVESGTGSAQPISLLYTKWHSHQEVYDTILNVPIYYNQDTYREFLTDSTGFRILFINQINQYVYDSPYVSTAYFRYTFDGEKYGFWYAPDDSVSGTHFTYYEESKVIVVPSTLLDHPQYAERYYPIEVMPEYDKSNSEQASPREQLLIAQLSRR